MEDLMYVASVMFVKYIYGINCTHYYTFICSCWSWITLNLGSFKPQEFQLTAPVK